MKILHVDRNDAIRIKLVQHEIKKVIDLIYGINYKLERLEDELNHCDRMYKSYKIRVELDKYERVRTGLLLELFYWCRVLEETQNYQSADLGEKK